MNTDLNGSCWDESPFGPGESNGLLCELKSGHAGAHRAGDAEWLTRNPRMSAERVRILDEARAFSDASHIGRVTAQELDLAIGLIRRMVAVFERGTPSHAPISDAQVMAALNAFWQYEPAITDPDYWSAGHRGIMRAALRAAAAVGGADVAAS